MVVARFASQSNSPLLCTFPIKEFTVLAVLWLGWGNYCGVISLIFTLYVV